MAITLHPGADGCITLKAAADLSTYQYHAVKISAAETVNLESAGHGVLAIGVLMNKPSHAGDDAKVMVQPGHVVPMVCTSAITFGTVITSDSSGHAVTTTTETDVVYGVAIDTTVAAGDLVSVLWTGLQFAADITRWTAGS